MKKRRLTIPAVFLSVGMTMFTTFALSKDVPMMTTDELESLLDNPELIVIDVRYDKHWIPSDSKMKGAVRERDSNVRSWTNRYPKDKLLGVYCA